MDIGCIYLFELLFLFSLDNYPGMELLDCMAVLFLGFWGVSTLFSIEANLHSHQQCMRAPFSAHPHQHLLFAFSLIIPVITSVRWYLFMVLIFGSLIIGSVQHLFMYQVAINWPLPNNFFIKISVCHSKTSCSIFFIGGECTLKIWKLWYDWIKICLLLTKSEDMVSCLLAC